jgi:toxin YhaV
MPLVVNGWTILYGDEFGRRYTELRAEVRRLQKTLPPEEYRRHPTVKLAAGVYRLVNEIVPADPDAPDFRLGRDLSRYRRAKGSGLPPRYRLFWACSSQAKTIIFLYLYDEGTLRKEGAATDP